MKDAITDSLRALRVLAIDCQASGATPAHGDLLELGWAACAAGSAAPAACAAEPVRSRWVLPRTERPIPRAIRELTGWGDACLAEAVPEMQAFRELQLEITRLAESAPENAVPSVIHYARFELPFLRDLHERLGAGTFPLDTVCLHAIAARLFPDLPRRNIRALAGFLGHSPELLRRSAGHVSATVFIWCALVPLLEEAGISTWAELKAWLAQPHSQKKRSVRRFPLDPQLRRALPSRPGVYRFLRRNGDVLYVGKATSLKARVSSHFKGRGPSSERVLELLTQVHTIDPTETASLLEAALLESDEIKRLDPPYNVQLRAGDRQAWFAAPDCAQAQSEPDDAHPIGPLPSQQALTPLFGLIGLADGRTTDARLRAMALCVPLSELPDDALFQEGWQAFARDHLAGGSCSVQRRVLSASRALFVLRGRTEPESAAEDPQGLWDLARVRRRLERALVHCGLLVRRARMLALLTDATVAFREPGAPCVRAVTIAGGRIETWCDLSDVTALAQLPQQAFPSRRQRQRAFDAATYDRLRVLLTELRRVQVEGGEVGLRLGRHTFGSERCNRLMQAL